MQKKNLLLLCDNYPLNNGEFFIDDEMKIIAGRFNKIFIITNKPIINNSAREYPDNAEIFYLPILDCSKLKSFFLIFSKLFIFELFNALTKQKIKISFLMLKIILNDLSRAILLKKTIETILQKNSNTILYSYWHDYKALTIAMLSEQDKHQVSLARAHRWDIYFEENEFPYLPFKNFMVKNLTMTYCISEDGKNSLLKRVGENLNHKIKVSKLGKSNNYLLNNLKTKDSYIICSCSSLTSVKRVNQIVEILSKVKTKNITWYHFGDGPLIDEISTLAKNQLTNCEYKLQGFVSNNDILKFYNEIYVDLFLNVSESEGIPVSIMEAQSAGIPVFATNVGGNKEIVNNTNGYIFDKNFNINKIAEQIDSFLSAPAIDILLIRDNALNNWKENYCAEKNYNDFFISINSL